MFNPIPDELLEYVEIYPTPSGLRWIKKPSKKVCIGDTAGNLDKHHGYWVLRFRGRAYRVNRVVCRIATGIDRIDLQVCHGDNDKTNNAPSNLRWDTQSGNELDKPIRGQVPYRNVFFSKGAFVGMWRVPMGDKRYCGRFKTPEAADAAVKADQAWYSNSVKASLR